MHFYDHGYGFYNIYTNTQNKANFIYDDVTYIKPRHHYKKQ